MKQYANGTGHDNYCPLSQIEFERATSFVKNNKWVLINKKLNQYKCKKLDLIGYKRNDQDKFLWGRNGKILLEVPSNLKKFVILKKEVGGIVYYEIKSEDEKNSCSFTEEEVKIIEEHKGALKQFNDLCDLKLKEKDL